MRAEVTSSCSCVPSARWATAWNPAASPVRRTAGACSAEGGDQGLSPCGVLGPHPAQVPVVAARTPSGWPARSGPGWARRGRSPASPRRPGRPGGRGSTSPAEPQGRGKGLADRADRDDPFGLEALERPDRLAVVAELGVIVVLDDDRVARAAPTPAARAAAPGVRTTPVGHWWAGVTTHHPGAAAVESGRRRSPRSSTGTGTQSHPAAARAAAVTVPTEPGSSTATRSRPCEASACSTTVESPAGSPQHDHDPFSARRRPPEPGRR